MTTTRRPSLHRLSITVGALALLSLAACSSDASPAATTPASDAPSGTEAEADEPATTNAAPVPASTVADGSATIVVNVGTDDFDASGGTRVVSVAKGTNVAIELTAASAESYHLHGYDIEADAEAGDPASLSFTADQTGRFDVESHLTEKTLLVLIVI